MPEKMLSEVGRASREQYEKGRQALDRHNLDYALSIFSQVLILEPGFYDCRAALRAAQRQKAGASTGFFKKVLGAASHSPMIAKGQFHLRNDPGQALQIAEEILNSDPNNTMAHKLLAEAALACDFPKSAVLSLEILFKNSSGDPTIARQLAEALAKTGQVDRAEQIFAELVKASPNDQELAQAYKNACARRTLSQGGYETIVSGEGSYRDILKDETEAVRLEQENRHQKVDSVSDTLLAEYLERLPREPQNIKLRRSIAELHSDAGRFDDALAAYEEIGKLEGGTDPSLERSIAETHLKHFNQKITLIEAAEGETSPAAAALRQERDAFQLADCKRRVDNYPTDLHLRFEYGQLLFRLGQVSQAIQEFQKSQNNPNKRIQSLNMLALCFTKRNMFDLAARTLQNAIKEKPAFDDEKKELIYSLGCVFEKMKKPEDAIEQFKQIYEVDIGYKEVASKVDAYYDSMGS